MDMEETKIDWEFYDPSEDQFHSIKGLASRYLFKISEESSELADVVVKNAAMGTMIGMTDDEIEKTGAFTARHVYSFLTILHVPTYQSKGFMKDILKWLKAKSAQDNSGYNQSDFLKYLEGPKLGLLLNERYLNLPQP